MADVDVITAEGTVIDTVHSFSRVAVEVAGRSREVLARLCGRLFKNHIRVLPGRIMERLTKGAAGRGRAGDG